MNEQSKPRRLPLSVMEVGEASNADIAAGRIESFDFVLGRLRQKIATRQAELEQEEGDPTTAK